MIACSKCIYTVYSQPSYCLTIQCQPLRFWMIDKLCQPAICYCVVNASTVHSQHRMIDKLCQPAIWYHVVNAYTQYTVNPPTVWLINITSTVNSNAWVILGGFLVDWTEFFFHLQVVNFLCFTSANNSFGFCVNILYANKLYIKSNFSHQIDHFILIN